MAEPASFEELEQAIGNVLDAKTTNFFKLAEMLELDPKQDFAGSDLSGTDFLRGNLAGANFVETNLCGANFAYSDLQGANFTNANLGILPSGYLARIKELNHLLNSYRARNPERVSFIEDVGNYASTLNRDLNDVFTIAVTITSGRAITIPNAALDLNSIRDLIRAFMSDLDFFLNLALYSALDLDDALVRALISSLNLDDDLNLALVHTRALTSVLEHVLTKVSDLDRAYELIRILGGGANFYGANLTGVVLDGANVEGTVMIDSTGLSSSEIADLEGRGAIFDSSLGDRSEVRVPVPR